MGRLFPKYNCLVTSKFGWRTLFGELKHHDGVDITGDAGNGVGQPDYIKAHTGGTVIEVGYEPEGAGNYVKIRVDVETIMVYFHMADNSIRVRRGDVIKTGEIIGHVGATGKVTGPHLHFGIMHKGSWIDPEPYLEADFPVSTAENGEEKKYWRVQIGSFIFKFNAIRRYNEVRAMGYSALIKKYGLMYRVQTGAFEIRENANKRLNEMKNLGYKDAFITDQGGTDVSV